MIAKPARRLMRLLAGLLACALASPLIPPAQAQAPAQATTPAAARPRAIAQITGAEVRLSDLFEGIDPALDHVLGPAPAPGARYVVPAEQARAIARDNGIDLAAGGAGGITVLRAGRPLARADAVALLRAALLTAGADAGSEIEVDAFATPLLPVGGRADLAIDLLRFDAPAGAFAADLNVAAPGMDPLRVAMRGRVVAMVSALVLTTRLPAGHVLSTNDLQPARLRATMLYGRPPLPLDAALGQALLRDTAAGTALAAGDVARPILVPRGAKVRMRLVSGTLLLEAAGIALEPGGAGETIRVMNPASRAVVLAQVTDAGEVAVAPDGTPPARARLAGTPPAELALR